LFIAGFFGVAMESESCSPLTNRLQVLMGEEEDEEDLSFLSKL
jgi:hypothetical protein